MTEQHAELNRQFTQKVQRGIFNPVKRHLKIEHEAEDRFQDALCQTWWAFYRYAVEKGKILDDALLVHSCRQRAVDLDRNFVPADGRRAGDVLDLRSFRDGRVVVHRVDVLDPSEALEGEAPMEVGLAEAEAASPEKKLNSALDLQTWIGDLTFRDQALMRRKMEGYDTAQVAHEMGTPYLVIWKRVRELGRELAQRAGVKIGGTKSRPKRPRQPRCTSTEALQ
jgi:hypothetical protein